MAADISGEIPGIDRPKLAGWLARTIPGDGDITALEVIAGGRSNLTYGIGLADGTRIVLRRPPLGHVLPTAHDMAREHRVLSRLHADGSVPVPRPLAFCDDEDVIGAPFYIMEYVTGRVLRAEEDVTDVTPEQARELSGRLAETLAAIHLVDVKAAGLADFGRPEGYMARQLRRWGQQWERSRQAIRETGHPDEFPAVEEQMDRLTERLARRLPGEGRGCLVHGDYRLDNVLARLEPRPEIAAVVDWEMSTLGDPLADLGLTLAYWADPGDEERQRIPVGARITATHGFLTSREIADRYATLTGFDLTDLDFYVAFAFYKLAVILEGIHARYLQHATVGEGFDEIGDSLPLLLGKAHQVLDGA